METYIAISAPSRNESTEFRTYDYHHTDEFLTTTRGNQDAV
jgi:hypothetical protein